MTTTQAFSLDQLRPDLSFKSYRLLEQTGLGGQSVVWSALDEAGGRVVAIKMSQPTEAQLQLEPGLFERQSELLASLHHPHIVPVIEYGTHGRVQYIVMPFLTGRSLHEWIQAGPLTHEEILRVAGEIASALDYLHARHIVHRDLKPSNILLDEDRRAYLADFGLARAFSETTQALHTGRGTMPYAPPEQHDMAVLTPQSDIFALGVLLFEMFARHLPWHGQKDLGVQQLRSDDELPDLIDSAPDAPPGLISALRRLTAAEPRLRPENAAEALAVLGRAMGVETRLPADDEALPSGGGLAALLAREAAAWDPSAGTLTLGLTTFAALDLAVRRNLLPVTTIRAKALLLTAAFTYNHQVEAWWDRLDKPKPRMAVCAHLVEAGNPVIIGRILDFLPPQAYNSSWPDLTLKPAGVAALLDLAAGARQPAQAGRALRLLQCFCPPAGEWRETAFSIQADDQLADLALAGTPQALDAARLIGHARSQAALQRVLDEADDDRLLAIIHTAAGGLPASLPRGLRLQAGAEALLRQLAADPRALALGYGLAALGCLLGFGFCIYITYRLPGFMDVTRFLVALERGVFLALPAAAGLVLGRAIVQRWTALPAAGRAALGALTAGLALAAGLWLYFLIFLDRLPDGWLYAAGSLLAAAGLVGGAGLRRPFSVALGAVALAVALLGAWLLSVPAGMSPMIYFEDTWPLLQTAGLCALVALPIALGANAVDLSPR